MAGNSEVPLTELATAATEVAEGDYESAKKIFNFTRPGLHTAEFQAVAEAFGLMTVKVEAREFRLERALDEIQRKNSALEEASRTRAEFGTISSFIIIVLCLYAMALSFMQQVVKVDLDMRKASVESISFGFLLIEIVMAAAFVSRHKPRPSDFGWTMRNWKHSVIESLGYSAAAILFMIFLKWLLVRYTPRYLGQPVLDWGYWGGWFTVISYLFVAPAQELVARGFLQNSIEKFLLGKNRTLLAILLTSAQFGVVHLHFSFTTGIIAMACGFYFGGIFARQRTLIGVSLSHYIVGTLAFGPLRLLGY